MFLRDIRHGIGETGIRASVLKCVTDEAGITPAIERVLRAIADAHHETDVLISTHTAAVHRRGLDQQDFFRKAGVDLGNVLIGHSGDTTDLAYLEALIDNGSYIGMDRFGLNGHGNPTFEERVDTVAQLCERGYADRMVLSHDTLCYTDCYDPAEFPDWHYNHIPDDVLPALLDRGVTQAQIDCMLIENPRRIFGATGGS
jgi:phosphotriesterase-related protein